MFDFQQLKKVWDDALEENFEDGMESLLSHNVFKILQDYKEEFIEKISDVELLNTINPEVISETFQAISRYHHNSIEEKTFNLMTLGLHLKSPIAREGAILALTQLDDKRAIDFLKISLDKENIEYLREEIKNAIGDLESEND